MFMNNKELSLEDFAALIDKISDSDKTAAYNVLYGMVLVKTVSTDSAPDPNVA